MLLNAAYDAYAFVVLINYVHVHVDGSNSFYMDIVRVLSFRNCKVLDSGKISSSAVSIRLQSIARKAHVILQRCLSASLGLFQHMFENANGLRGKCINMVYVNL